MVNRIDQIEDAFVAGDLQVLRELRCPFCAGALSYSIVKHLPPLSGAPPGRRYRAGYFIFCRGQCERLLSHFDGLCPEWAEEIEDWDMFRRQLTEAQ